MHESEHVSSETSIDPEELKELIARLANPSPDVPNGSVKIKDIAETLEVKEYDVIRQLTLLRAKRHDEQAAQQSRNQFQETNSLATMSLRQRRMVIAILCFALFIGFLTFFVLIRQASAVEPPQAVPRSPIEKTVPPIQVNDKKTP